MEENQRELTSGEQLAGITFNPGGSPSVDDVKFTAAQFIDSIYAAQKRFDYFDDIQIEMFNQAKIRALEAQMLAVKAITWNLNK